MLSFVVQHITVVLGFMKGQVVQGFWQGPDPLGMVGGRLSVLTRVCLRFFTRLLTSRNFLSSRYLVSPDEASIRLLWVKILEIGGFFGLCVIMNGIGPFSVVSGCFSEFRRVFLSNREALSIACLTNFFG